MGGEFKALYMTMGDYDLIAIYEAPDDAVAARFTLLLAQMGSVRTRTLKAFAEAAYRDIIKAYIDVDAKDYPLLGEIREICDGGAFGSIIGRNSFQRKKPDALRLLDTIMKMYAGEIK